MATHSGNREFSGNFEIGLENREFSGNFTTILENNFVTRRRDFSPHSVLFSFSERQRICFIAIKQHVIILQWALRMSFSGCWCEFGTWDVLCEFLPMEQGQTRIICKKIETVFQGSSFWKVPRNIGKFWFLYSIYFTGWEFFSN